MKRFLFGLGACLLACGASAPPAESPADVESSAADAAAEPEPAEKAEAEPESTPAAARASEGAPATKEDIQAVLQLVVEDEELTPFLHLEQPDRFPLKIAGDFPPGLELVKATKPVEIVDAAEAKKKPVIVFTEIDVGPSRAQVRYRYDVESVKGASTLEKRDGHWVLVKSRITERQELKR